ncbi:chondroitinase-B domain-containing protein [Hyphococcus sp.]|uniref:chondroitinase-B domain-containing protein n=1 Tax=Hyphococcus sp. TaxID=2038636 RepID=UPI003CCBB80B
MGGQSLLLLRASRLKRIAGLTLAATLLGANPVLAEDYLVKDQGAYEDALKRLQPGDKLILADGVWRDFEIVFQAVGEEGAPILLTAQTPGKVIISGQSNLRIAGEHLEVSGLVFKNGYTPTSEVISFRVDSKTVANNSRITQVVIDNYNQPERQEVDFWVMMYGKNNRFDHNHIVGKRNKGVTMAVRLNTEASQENHHRIDHNYFGPRPILGSNGGETLRIGTSHYSLTDSYTVVENNYFDRADGELEIISNKSGKNTFRNNTFYKSRGTLTMRHGNDNLVEGNVFFGEDVDHTGGIRVINAGQVIRNNYMEGLKGTRFGGAFVVMNGVPNSPINRYHQVKDARITNNSLINSDNIQLAAGSDAERSAVPVDSEFSSNLIYHESGENVFTVYDDVSGITFSENVIAPMNPPDFAEGFRLEEIALERAGNGLLYPAKDIDAGAPRDLVVVTKEETGVSWYPKSEPIVEFESGRTIEVSPQQNALFEAVSEAEPGDTIVLQPGEYVVSKFLKINKPISIKGRGKVDITFERSALFEILDGGSLRLSRVNISGGKAPDNAGNAVIRTSPYSMLENYRLEIIDTHFTNMDVNHSFNIISAAKGTFADNILIKDSSVKDVTGAVLKLDKEIDDYGIYNAEYLTISNSTFENIQGALVDFYRGGTDESTFGPHFELKDSRLSNVGGGNRNKSKTSIHLHGVQVTEIYGNTIEDSEPFLINHTVGEPKTRIHDNAFINTPLPENNELNSGLKPTAEIENNKVKNR